MPRADLAFEHKILNALKKRTLPKRWLLAVSGGVDSMVLAEFCRKWQRGLGCELALAHVHHGLDGKSDRFRNRAQKLVKRWAQEHDLVLFTNRPEKLVLRSEAELREYRHAWLEKWKPGFDVVVYAHHSDDLLETRLLRLIRGTGPGGLKAMRVLQSGKLRPLLSVSRAEIEGYAKARALKWCDDPSNQRTETLRNWLRHDWLPRLEHRQKGATQALHRSLSLLSHHQPISRVANHVGVRRDSVNERVVAEYLQALGLRNYGRSHVQEILKRIDTRQKNLSFKMLGVVFVVTPDFLRASRV